MFWKVMFACSMLAAVLHTISSNDTKTIINLVMAILCVLLGKIN